MRPAGPPLLKTTRLLLRPFEAQDAAAVHALVGDPEVLSTLVRVPDPYEEGTAARWIAGHPDAFARGESVNFAITLRGQEVLIGAIGLALRLGDARASLGYWIGRAHWGNGYATEAARAVLGFAFEEMNLHRVQADHLVRNPASGRVMQKLGMTREGTLREHFVKRGVFETVETYGILRGEFERG
jgi:RimJ/RimL family protein N-acetyltransferase